MFFNWYLLYISMCTLYKFSKNVFLPWCSWKVCCTTLWLLILITIFTTFVVVYDKILSNQTSGQILRLNKFKTKFHQDFVIKLMFSKTKPVLYISVYWYLVNVEGNTETRYKDPGLSVNSQWSFNHLSYMRLRYDMAWPYTINSKSFFQYFILKNDEKFHFDVFKIRFLKMIKPFCYYLPLCLPVLFVFSLLLLCMWPEILFLKIKV